MPENVANRTPTTNTLILENADQWWQKSSKNMIISGFHRAGVDNNKRIHLLHGNGFSAMTLAAVASQFPTDWNIWLTNIPGHGESTQPAVKVPNWQDMANSIADAIYQQANVKERGPLIGVGHSMGGVLTLLAAAKYPDLFSEIILLDPILFKPNMIFAQRLLRVTGTWRQRALVKSVANRTAVWQNLSEMKKDIAKKSFYKPWHQQVINDYCQYSTHEVNNNVALSCSPAWEASIFGSYPVGLWRAVKKLTVPTMILQAQKSYFFIPSAVKRAVKKNNNIQWQVFGNHHCFPMEQPIETANILTQLINKNSEAK